MKCAQHRPKSEEKKQSKDINKAKDTDHNEDSADEKGRLPHRVALSAFSKSVGHRPMGIQVAQVRLFCGACSAIVQLDIHVEDCVGLPQHPPNAVADGLRCSALSTSNDLR